VHKTQILKMLCWCATDADTALGPLFGVYLNEHSATVRDTTTHQMDTRTRPKLGPCSVTATLCTWCTMNDEIRTQAQRVLGHQFNDIDLLDLALRHASISESRLDSNERLEFLGDAILGMIVCERIYNKFPSYLEGEMTKIKSLAVSRKICAKIAIQLGLEQLIVVGKGMQTQTELPQSLAAAVLESVIAALYIDGGMQTVRDFLEPLLDPLLDEAVLSGHQHNFKSVLQQHAQRELNTSPNYRILDEKGPDHAKAFLIAVELDGSQYEACWGNSKKAAEQQAALNALHHLGLTETSEQGKTRMKSQVGVVRVFDGLDEEE
jgi:ribonuclease-3